MKISVSLPEDDVAALDLYAEEAGLPSRSAAVQHAIHLLSARRLQADYAAAWAEWDTSGEAQTWDQTTGDGWTNATG